MEWVRQYRWLIVFGLLFVLAGSSGIWLWESGQLTAQTGERSTLEVEVAALKALHDENNRLQAEIIGLKEELTTVATEVSQANERIAGAKTSTPSSTVTAPTVSAASEHPEPVAQSATININTATQAELESLPGIGPAKAAAILEYRTANGPFTSVDQLTSVKGIGEKTFQSLSHLVVIQ